MQGTKAVTYNSYFNLFLNCKNHGLPHGNSKGWLNELPWVIDFLNMMIDVSITIDNWFADKQVRRLG